MALSVAQHDASNVKAIRTPALIAIERLGKLAAQGVAPHRLAGAAMDILADWRSRGIPAGEIEVLHADIEAGVQAAQDYVAEAESETAKVAAARQLEALGAVRLVLVEELERLG